MLPNQTLFGGLPTNPFPHLNHDFSAFHAHGTEDRKSTQHYDGTNNMSTGGFLGIPHDPLHEGMSYLMFMILAHLTQILYLNFAIIAGMSI